MVSGNETLINTGANQSVKIFLNIIKTLGSGKLRNTFTYNKCTYSKHMHICIINKDWRMNHSSFSELEQLLSHAVSTQNASCPPSMRRVSDAGQTSITKRTTEGSQAIRERGFDCSGMVHLFLWEGWSWNQGSLDREKMYKLENHPHPEETDT